VDGAQVSALKPAEDGDGAVLRLWNPTSAHVVAGIVGIDGSLTECDLAETVSAEVFDASGGIPLGPYATWTLRLRDGSRPSS
jgi:alpha-mannosidase/mannosylglycerate hydrolase